MHKAFIAVIFFLSQGLCLADTTVLEIKGNARGIWQGHLLIKSTVFVETGDTLVIKAGTEVIMGGADARLVVQGIVYADGSVESPIVFRPLSVGGTWDKLFFKSLHPSELHNCHFLGAKNSIYAVGTSLGVQGCLFKNSGGAPVTAKHSRIYLYQCRFPGLKRSPVDFDSASVVGLEDCHIPGKPTAVKTAEKPLKRKKGVFLDYLSHTGVKTGLNYQLFNKDENQLYKYQQVTMPLLVNFPLGSFSRVMVNTAASEMNDVDNDKTIRALTDTRLQWVYFTRYFMIMLGCNLPTGKSKVTPKESALINSMADEDLLFSVKQYGEGIGVNAGASYARKLTKQVEVGLGLGFYNKGVYERYTDTTSKYDPGDMLVVTGGADYSQGNAMARLDFTGSFFGKEVENERGVFQNGSMYLLKLSWMHEMGPLSYVVSVYDLLRGKTHYLIGDKLTEEPVASFGNRVAISADVEYKLLKNATTLAGMGLRFDDENEYGDGSPLYKGKRLILTARAGESYAFSQNLALEGLLKIHRGSQGPGYALSGGIEYTGMEGELTLKYNFR